MAGVELVEDGESLRQIEDMFRRRNRTMPERNRVQALFPAGAEPIPNERGTAPGVGCVWATAFWPRCPAYRPRCSPCSRHRYGRVFWRWG